MSSTIKSLFSAIKTLAIVGEATTDEISYGAILSPTVSGGSITTSTYKNVILSGETSGGSISTLKIGDTTLKIGDLGRTVPGQYNDVYVQERYIG